MPARVVATALDVISWCAAEPAALRRVSAPTPTRGHGFCEEPYGTGLSREQQPAV